MHHFCYDIFSVSSILGSLKHKHLETPLTLFRFENRSHFGLDGKKQKLLETMTQTHMLVSWLGLICLNVSFPGSSNSQHVTLFWKKTKTGSVLTYSGWLNMDRKCWPSYIEGQCHRREKDSALQFKCSLKNSPIKGWEMWTWVWYCGVFEFVHRLNGCYIV